MKKVIFKFNIPKSCITEVKRWSSFTSLSFPRGSFPAIPNKHRNVLNYASFCKSTSGIFTLATACH